MRYGVQMCRRKIKNLLILEEKKKRKGPTSGWQDLLE